MSRKRSQCVSFSPDVLEKAAQRASPEKDNMSRSKRSKAKACGRLRNKLCIPRLCRGSSLCLAPLRMLERLVRALFRSCSKNGSSSPPTCERNHHPSAIKCYPGHFSPDLHYTEVIEDCIEFFKKSSCADQRVP